MLASDNIVEPDSPTVINAALKAARQQ